MAESKKEGFGAELGQHTLHVHVVGAAFTDLSAVVSQPLQEGSPVHGATKSFVVGVQDAGIAAVAVQRMEGVAARRGDPSLKPNQFPLLEIHDV